tara:strand:- start:442 stop:837 length:396 start_codon:yes stop_codon:yes gene_type:complete
MVPVMITNKRHDVSIETPHSKFRPRMTEPMSCHVWAIATEIISLSIKESLVKGIDLHQNVDVVLPQGIYGLVPCAESMPEVREKILPPIVSQTNTAKSIQDIDKAGDSGRHMPFRSDTVVCFIDVRNERVI